MEKVIMQSYKFTDFYKYTLTTNKNKSTIQSYKLNHKLKYIITGEVLL